jgi:predicted MPP superfamily phosphohydrolase
MKSTIDRRRFLRMALTGAPLVLAGDALAVEPQWLSVKTVRVGTATPTHRLVHISDLHYKGDEGYLREIVEQVNAQKPDFVCFTGDLVEQASFLSGALAGLRGIHAPLYGVPGNHDFMARVNFRTVEESFAATGGGWLSNRQAQTRDRQVNLIGMACDHELLPSYKQAGMKNIVLMHYPAFVKKLGTPQLDLILAGHSHGGQVRLPWVGALVLPDGVGEYDLGLYATAAGPLYVNPGLGYLNLDIRFNCRPEITVIEV